MSEKDIYKLFNGIKIDECETEDINESINDIQKERVKKNLNKKIKGRRALRNFKYGVTAAGVGIACVIGVGLTNPSLAENIPVLNSIIQKLNDNYDGYGEYSKYSKILGESVTSNGVTLTINEVLADEARLIISYTIKGEEKLDDLAFSHALSSLKINGKTWGGGGSAIGEYLDDYTYVASEEVNLELATTFKNSISTEELNLKSIKDLNINLKARELMGVKGRWDFAFSVSKDEVSKNTTIFRPDKKIDFPDSIVNINKVTLSPLGTYISLSGEYKNNRKNDASNVFDSDYWLAFDDKGIQLVPNGIGGGTSDPTKFDSQMTYDKLKDNSKYLTILPCNLIPSGGGGVSFDANGVETAIATKTKKPKEIGQVIDGRYPIELDQGKMGKLTIKDIVTEGDTTKVKYIAEGIAPYTQASSLYIKDETGEDIIPKSYDIKENEKNPNEFVLKFKALNPNKKYTIYTTDFSNFEIREDLKFNIDLK